MSQQQPPVTAKTYTEAELRAFEWWSPQPVAGQVYWCQTPRVNPPEPGPVLHPALIFAVRQYSAEHPWYQVRIAAGTSQHVDNIYPGELLVSDNGEERDALKRAGLYKATKFDLTRLAWIPFTKEFFRPHPDSNTGHPYAGVLDFSVMSLRRKLSAAKAKAGLP